MKKLVWFTFLIFLAPLYSFSQDFEAFKKSKVSTNQYFSLSFQNDLPYRTDYYFSNGINSELIAPAIARLPLAKLMPSTDDETLNYYGLKVVQNIYTPVLLYSKNIEYNDRPFASELYLGYSNQSFNSRIKSKKEYEILIGLIGKYSFGQYIQSSFHEAIHNQVPTGWKYQIKSDIVLNYNYKSEQPIFLSEFLEMHYSYGFRAGTLYDDLGLGSQLRIGLFNPYYRGLGQVNRKSAEGRSSKNFQFYAYCKPKASFIVYNALLEGGILSQSSLFKLQTSEIEPIVFQLSTGAAIQYRFLQILAETNYISREIKLGRPHQWVNVKLLVNF